MWYMIFEKLKNKKHIRVFHNPRIKTLQNEQSKVASWTELWFEASQLGIQTINSDPNGVKAFSTLF